MTFARKLAALLPALLRCFALSGTAHAQRSPSAAPTGDPAQSQPLAAPTTNVEVTQTGGTTGPEVGGISVVSLFMRADPLVQTVMVLLMLASRWSWGIIMKKSVGK